MSLPFSWESGHSLIILHRLLIIFLFFICLTVFFKDWFMLASSILFLFIPLPLGKHFCHTHLIFISEWILFCLKSGTLYILFSLPITVSFFPCRASQISLWLSCIHSDISFRKSFPIPSLEYTCSVCPQESMQHSWIVIELIRNCNYR